MLAQTILEAVRFKFGIRCPRWVCFHVSIDARLNVVEFALNNLMIWIIFSLFAVVEERRFADELNKKRLAAYLASAMAVAVPEQQLSFMENPLMRVLQRKIPDFVSFSLDKMEPQSSQRRFIGDQQMNQIYSLTTFTESDVRKLVAVFALEEIV